MTINISRFYKRERWELDCEIITPMFLGNASQEAELRAAPFKGLLRYWWRVANGWRYPTPGELLQAESKIFGSPDEQSGGKSMVTVGVCASTKMAPMKDNFVSHGLVDHPECEKSNRKTNPLNFLAGMGLIHYKNGMLHSYFSPGEKFRLNVTCCHEAREAVQSALHLIGAFGAIGSRSRNGWGCFSLGIQKHLPSHFFYSADKAFERDYPHCLGKNDKGPLLWETKGAPHASWSECMKLLADIYISIRAGNVTKGISRLEVKSGSPPERHLLGYPVTNHFLYPIKKEGGQIDKKHPEYEWRKNWGNQGRHGSALRLIVRKEADGHRGYILHLPHLFSKDMWPEADKDRQIKIWQKVHSSLDQLCQRVQLEEARS